MRTSLAARSAWCLQVRASNQRLAPHYPHQGASAQQCMDEPFPSADRSQRLKNHRCSYVTILGSPTLWLAPACTRAPEVTARLRISRLPCTMRAG